MSNPLIFLIDADMLVFEVCSVCETEIHWGDGLWTLHADAGEAKGRLDDIVQNIVNKVLAKLKYVGAYEILMCFSDDHENFRKKILPTYKANRIGKRKPICYREVKSWVKDNYTVYQRPSLEADDCIGILATTSPNAVIVSGDKDFETIPGKFYNYRKEELYVVSAKEAAEKHLYQTLIGDAADNYSGCPSVGPKTAEKLLAGDKCTWETVVKQFVKKGLTEQDALVQARVAKILQKENYDFKRKEPILWNPI